jgi:hypothetical protein
MNSTEYLHILDGRMRVKVPELRGSNATAAIISDELLSLGGVTQVKANTVTGNILVLFESETVTPEHILNLIGKHKSYAKPNQAVRRPSAVTRNRNPLQPHQVQRVFMDLLLQTSIEFALKKLIFAAL